MREHVYLLVLFLKSWHGIERVQMTGAILECEDCFKAAITWCDEVSYTIERVL